MVRYYLLLSPGLAHIIAVAVNQNGSIAVDASSILTAMDRADPGIGLNMVGQLHRLSDCARRIAR
jgi:hypothetical protein